MQVRSYHEGRKFQCTSCDSKFYTRQKLCEHLAEHGQERARARPRTGEERRRRRDKGRFKVPMAAVLTGVRGGEARRLLEDEVRPLDSVEVLAAEAAELLGNSSEAASEEEVEVRCRRRWAEGRREEEVVGVVHRPPATPSFRRMWQESDTDTDTESKALATDTAEPPGPNIDFSRFLRK